jgi:phosphatidylglycerol---prolipoprotein diacylglyceryl transferase
MHPRLFTIGGFTQHTYGFLVATAFVVGLLVAVRLARREGLDTDKVFNLGVYVALAAVVGAKVLLILTDLSFYLRSPREMFSLASLQAGGVFYGGFLGAVALALWYTRYAQLPLLKVCDVFAPAVSLGHAIGRLGCFSAGCCYGKPTSLPWGVTFTDPYSHDMFGTPLGIRLHPTQLYEALAETMIFFLLLARFRKKQFDGQVMALYVGVYGVVRFCLEFVRDDPDRGFVFGGWMSTSQFIAIIMMAAAAMFWAWKRMAPKPQPQPAVRPARRPV